MAKTKLEKIADIELQMSQLDNQRKQLIQKQKEQERKNRTRRLCKRAGLLESMLPDTISLTDEHFKIFLEKTILTEHSRRILDGFKAMDTDTTAAKSTHTEQESGADESEDGGSVGSATG